MRSVLVTLLFAMALLPRVGSAQRQPTPLLSSTRVAFAATDSASRRQPPAARAVPRGRGAHAKRGALLGLVAGAVVGAIAGVGIANDLGCDMGTSGCKGNGLQLSTVLLSTSAGATVGVASGALVGALWPVRSASTP